MMVPNMHLTALRSGSTRPELDSCKSGAWASMAPTRCRWYRRMPTAGSRTCHPTASGLCMSPTARTMCVRAIIRPTSMSNCVSSRLMGANQNSLRSSLAGRGQSMSTPGLQIIAPLPLFPTGSNTDPGAHSAPDPARSYSAQYKERKTMNIQPVKTAIVGCGVISDAYLKTMTQTFKILDVVGCCDQNAERARAMAQKYGRAVLTVDEILADPSIEIVVNLTTPVAHYPVTKQLLEGGKHVYTEKVLSVELEHAAELVAIAQRKNLYLGAAPDTFLGAAIQTARYVVESGMLGEITSCFCALTRDGDILNRAFPFTTKPGGGIGFDVGIYYVTALLSILGPIQEVSGIVQTRRPQRPEYALDRFGEPFQIECENSMAATLQFDCGTIGNMLFDANSVLMLPEKPSVVLFGTLGVLYMADPNSFGGDVRVLLKGNNEPFTMQQSHAFSTECRGLGVAEMAWSMRMGRKNRANKEMAYHALEVLHSLATSSQTKSNRVMKSTFAKMPPMPRGYSGQKVFEFVEETGIAL